MGNIAGKDNATVCVIGGGIAGLSAAVFLINSGFDVTLIESSPRLGGRAYSFFDKTLNDWVDNGQHILASWYKNTFDFFKIIGTFDRLKFQHQLAVKFADLDGKRYHFKCPKLLPPFHLIWGIWNYKVLGFKDKLGIIRLVNSILLEKYEEDELKTMNTAGFFVLTKQTKNVMDYFWKPFIAAVFNAEPEETSAWQFTQIMKLGFLTKGGSNLVLPKSNLNELYVNKAEEYLTAKGAKIFKSQKIKGFNIKEKQIASIILWENHISEFDYYISAIPFFEFRNIFPDEILNGEYNMIKNLVPSPIINLHFEFETVGLMSDDFIGIVNGTIQWVFKVNDKRICVVISSAKNLVNMDKDELIDLCRNELCQCLPAFRDAELTYARVVKEMRATFLPDTASVSSRPECKTKIKNLFIAGDWVNTGYPATIESAVTSSKNCVNEIMNLKS
jgi:squalene-associated FAD-dependent desaturase